MGDGIRWHAAHYNDKFLSSETLSRIPPPLVFLYILVSLGIKKAAYHSSKVFHEFKMWSIKLGLLRCRTEMVIKETNSEDSTPKS